MDKVLYGKVLDRGLSQNTRPADCMSPSNTQSTARNNLGYLAMAYLEIQKEET